MVPKIITTSEFLVSFNRRNRKRNNLSCLSFFYNRFRIKTSFMSKFSDLGAINFNYIYIYLFNLDYYLALYHVLFLTNTYLRRG